MSSIYTIPANSAVLIANNNTTNTTCRSVYIGTDGDYQFYFPTTATWVRYKECKAGSMLPLAVSGARLFTGSAAPTSGDITFNY